MGGSINFRQVQRLSDTECETENWKDLHVALFVPFVVVVVVVFIVGYFDVDLQ